MSRILQLASMLRAEWRAGSDLAGSLPSITPLIDMPLPLHGPPSFPSVAQISYTTLALI